MKNPIKNFVRFVKDEAKTLRYLIHNRIYVDSKSEQGIVDQFHNLYHNSQLFGRGWGNMFWLGFPILKYPSDMWVYQEIIFETKPDVIIECGTAHGGSALFLASLCDLMNNGKVITIDIEVWKNKENRERPKHERITYLLGPSTSEEIEKEVKRLIGDKTKVLVILDSDHHKEHVLNELKVYSKFVNKGSYVIVEDTSLNGHPIIPDFGPGPMEAVDEFLKNNEDFVIDKTRQKFYLTNNPNGYLKKVK